MEIELRETIQGLLLQFMQNMHEWEMECNEIAKQNELSFEKQHDKQKKLLLNIFAVSCTVRERKNGRPNTISYGTNDYFDYDVTEENIIDIVEEGENKIIVHTYRVAPSAEKMQYVFLFKKGKWLIDSKKRYSSWKQKWQPVSL